MKRPRGKAECPGQHTPDAPGWRDLDAVVCRHCWWQLPLTVRKRIRNGVPPGASAAAMESVKRQLLAGIHPSQVEVGAHYCPACHELSVQPHQHQCKGEQ